MVLSTRVGATALASLVALSSVANAQGFYYQDTRLQCGPQYNFQYLGCAATNTTPFAFSPNQWDPAVTADLSRSSINYDIGDFVNMTGTPYFCSLFCRSHGFKFTALFDKGCHCGNTLNYTPLGGTAVNLENTINATSDDRCNNGLNGNPYPPCGGDRRENCGSNGGARIFVDPSFPDERSLPELPTLARGYGPLGCFKKARFPSGDDTITRADVQSTESCFEYCADLGMPYVYMESTTTNIKCNCGSEFNQNSAQASIDVNLCTQKCSNATDTTACQGQDCCGTGDGPFPVYANPNLMGCFTPIIPGVENPDTETPAPNGYNCFSTPQSILARATSSVSYASRTMSASASFIATASPAANAFVNFGCWANTPVTQLFPTVFNYTLADTQLDVDKCVAFCDGANHNYAAVWGNPQTQCVCGDGFDSTATPNGAMEDCNQPCAGSVLQNCGGENGPLVYAKSNITPNRWADLYTSSWSRTITYSCTPTAASTTTAPASNTTTPAGTTTTPASNTTTPASSTTIPSSNTTIPASSTTTPAGTTTTPASNTTIPASSITTPASNTTIPASSITTPSSNTTIPASSTTTRPGSTTTPAGSTTPTTSPTGSSSPGGSTSGGASTSSSSASTSSGDPGSSSGGATGTGTTAPTGSQSSSSIGGPGNTSSSQSSSVPTGSGVVTPIGGDPGTATASPSGNGGAADTAALPEKDGVFVEGHAPDDHPCTETTMSWVPGEPTFLPDRDEL